jgi:hypothetical protein
MTATAFLGLYLQRLRDMDPPPGLDQQSGSITTKLLWCEEHASVLPTVVDRCRWISGRGREVGATGLPAVEPAIVTGRLGIAKTSNSD